MRTILLALFFCNVFATINPFYSTEDGVVVLTDDTFEQAIYEFEYALVEFYAPWCSYCQKLVPEYAKAAQTLAESHPEIKLCKIDATKEIKTAKKYEVRGYPTMLFFIKGRKNPIPFEYVSSAREIVDWLLKKAGPAYEVINTVQEAENLLADKEVVAFFFGPTGSEAFDSFVSVANDMDEIVYAYTNEQTVKDKYDITSDDSIVLFKKFDEGRNTYTGPFNHESILEFINKNRYPTVMRFDHRFAGKIFGASNPVLFLISDPSEAGVKAKEVLREIAHEIKDKIVLVSAAINEPMVDMLMGTIGVVKERLPAIRIFKPSPEGPKKYALEEEFTGHNIKTFVENFVNQKLRPFLKSEPVPEQPCEDDVRVVVGKNFEEVVLGDDNDVLMVYYAPMCGPCKEMAPTYSSLARNLKDVEGLVIGKMDLTKNEAESLKTKGFPTIRFYPKGDKSNPIDFLGEKTEEDFLDFIKKHTTLSHPKLSKQVDTEL